MNNKIKRIVLLILLMSWLIIKVSGENYQLLNEFQIDILRIVSLGFFLFCFSDFYYTKKQILTIPKKFYSIILSSKWNMFLVILILIGIIQNFSLNYLFEFIAVSICSLTARIIISIFIENRKLSLFKKKFINFFGIYYLAILPIFLFMLFFPSFFEIKFINFVIDYLFVIIPLIFSGALTLNYFSYYSNVSKFVECIDSEDIESMLYCIYYLDQAIASQKQDEDLKLKIILRYSIINLQSALPNILIREILNSIYSRLIQFQPPEAMYFAYYGQFLFFEYNDIEAGIEYNRKALQIDSKFEDAYVNIATILKSNDRSKEALELLNNFIEIAENDPADAYFIRGTIYQDYFLQNELALADYTKAINLSSNTPNKKYLKKRAELYIEWLKDFEKALKDYDIIVSNSFDDESIKMRGLIKFALKDYKGTIDDMKKVASADSLASFYKNLAIGQSDQKNEFMQERLDEYQEENLTIFAKSLPAMELDGDFFSISKVKKSDVSVKTNYFFTLLDVQGKGYQSAIMAKSISELLNDLDKENPSSVLHYINSTLISNTGGVKRRSKTQFTTCITGKIVSNAWKKNVSLTFSNAGHLNPLILRNSEFIELDNLGNALNIDSKSEYYDSIVDLEKGDLIVFYTDGYIEQKNSEQTDFGIEQLKKFILDNQQKKINILLEELNQEILKFGNGILHDDLSIIGVKIN